MTHERDTFDEGSGANATDRSGGGRSVAARETVDRRQFLAAIGVAGSLLGTGSASARSPSPTTLPEGATIGLETVAEGLTSPVGFEVPTPFVGGPQSTQAPQTGDQQFVVDQVGQIRVVEDGGLRTEPFLDLGDRIVDLNASSFEDRGLLGLAFHPEFADNRRFYVRYSAPPRGGTPDGFDHTFVLSEFRATPDLSDGDPDSERALLEIPEPGFNQNAGSIAFGPDGYLYVTVGDGGGNDSDRGLGHVDDWYGANAGGNGQDVTENLLGSVLRIDVDGREGDRAYAIPDGNPLVGRAGLDEHYAWGFRNPWRLSFDSQGRLFVSDTGQDLREEVNLVESGGNYGWNVREGTVCLDADDRTSPRSECPDAVNAPGAARDGEPLVDPIVEYAHADDVATVVGGYVYEGDEVDALEGAYVFGDWFGRLFTATESVDAGAWSMRELRVAGTDDGRLAPRHVVSFGRDADGELYVLTSAEATPRGTTGRVSRIVSA